MPDARTSRPRQKCRAIEKKTPVAADSENVTNGLEGTAAQEMAPAANVERTLESSRCKFKHDARGYVFFTVSPEREVISRPEIIGRQPAFNKAHGTVVLLLNRSLRNFLPLENHQVFLADKFLPGFNPLPAELRPVNGDHASAAGMGRIGI